MIASAGSHSPEDYIGLVDDLSIPGVSPVAARINAVLSFFLPKQKSEVEKILLQVLEMMQDAYGMVLKALTVKALEIYTNNVDDQIKVLADHIQGTSGFDLSQSDINAFIVSGKERNEILVPDESRGVSSTAIFEYLVFDDALSIEETNVSFASGERESQYVALLSKLILSGTYFVMVS